MVDRIAQIDPLERSVDVWVVVVEVGEICGADRNGDALGAGQVDGTYGEHA